MKTLLVMISFAASIVLTACGNNNSAQQQEIKKDTTSGNATATNESHMVNTGISSVLYGYLSIKNALATDDGNKAASSAKNLNDALSKVNESAMSQDVKKVYTEVKADILEHAEHIGANASNIAHQREHFDILSKDVIDLVNATGSSQTLYKDFCPMYNGKKGAFWLSETKDISNPYYGKTMQTCGELKQEIGPKG